METLKTNYSGFNHCQTKQCTKCNETKDICEFHHDQRVKSTNLYCWCKKCKNEYARNSMAKNAEHHRKKKAVYAITRYGISVDEYNNMREAQGFKCAICGKPETECKKRLHIDHCHTTGKVRGLLCKDCNCVLGSMNDDVGRLEAAIKYLQESSCD